MANAASVKYWDVGETRGPICEILPMQADGAIAKGDVVTCTGSTDDGVAKCKVIGNAEAPVAGVALFEAASGKMTQVLVRGVVRPKQVNDTTAIPAGGAVAHKNGKLTGAGAGSRGPTFGVALTAAAAAGGDSIIMFVNGLRGGTNAS